MGCGSSVHSKDVPAAEGRPEKPVKKTTEPHVNTASAECKQDPFMVSTEELQQRRQRSKSEIRLVEISNRRSIAGLGTATGSRGLLNIDSGGQQKMRRSFQNRRVSMVRSFETSIKQLLDSDDSQFDEDMSEEDKLMLVFKKFAKSEENGTEHKVRVSDLRDGFEKMSFNKSQQEVDVMFGLCDTDNDGHLNWNEFSSFFRNLVQDLKPCDDDNDGDDADSTANANETALKQFAHKRSEGEAPSLRKDYAFGKRPIKGYSLQHVESLPTGVRSVCCSRNRPLLATADFESSLISLYDIQGPTPKLVRMVQGQSDGAIEMSMDKKAFAVSGRESTLTVSDMTVGCVMQELDHVGAVTCCTFPVGGKAILTACQDNAVRYFQVSRGKLLKKSEKLPNSKTGVIVSLSCHKIEAGSTIAVSRTHEHYVRILSAASFNQLHTLRGHRTTVWGSQYSYDGTQLLSHCDKLIKVWNPLTKETMMTLDIRDAVGDSEDSVWTTATFASELFSHIVVGVSNDLIVFVNITDQSLLLKLPSKYPVCSIGSLHTQDKVCCGDEQGNLFIIKFW